MILRAVVIAILVAGVAAVGAAPAAAGGGCHRVYEEGQTEATGSSVEMKENCFGPTILRTPVGTVVTFTNADPHEHDVTGTSWASGRLPEGGRFSHRFDEPGTFPFSCTLHPTMTGAVVVGGAEPDDRRSSASPAPVPVAGAAVAGFAGGWVARRRRTTAA